MSKSKARNSKKSSKVSSKASKLSSFLKIFSVVPILLALIIFFLGFFPIKYPIINGFIRSELQLSGMGIEKADQIYVTLWKGISLQKLIISQKFDQNWGLKCTLKSVTMNCNVVKTFIRWKEFKKKYPLPQKKSVSLNMADSLDIYIMRAREMLDKCQGMDILGNLSFTKNDSCVFFMDDFDMKVIFEDSLGVLKLFCKSDSCNLFQNSLDKMRCSLKYKNGNVDISDLSTRFGKGIIRVIGGVNTSKMKLNRLHVVGSDLDISEVCNRYLKAGKLNCVADLKLDLNSSALNIDSLKIDGIVKTSVLEISDLPLQEPFSQIVFMNKLPNVSFTDFETTFKTKPESKYDVRISGIGQQLKIESNGWFSLDGALEQRIEGVIAESFAKEFPRIVVGTLPRKNAGRYFKCRLFGTLREPKIELDKEILQHAVKNIFTNIKLNIREKKASKR